MMTKINSLDATYKAQFAELSEMGGAVESLENAGESLGKAVTSTSDANTIKSQLQTFVDRYNAWVKEFDGTVSAGGVLNGTQAAEVSLAELRIAVENRFNGAAQGVHGLSDLGITIDENTHLAMFDTSKLDSALSSNQCRGCCCHRPVQRQLHRSCRPAYLGQQFRQEPAGQPRPRNRLYQRQWRVAQG